MLDDPRSLALANRFAGRWLGFEDLPTQAVDVRRFRGTHDGLKRAMVAERTLFFDALVREDRSLLELVDSGTTFLNATLAGHYGVAGVEGGEMRRVALDERVDVDRRTMVCDHAAARAGPDAHQAPPNQPVLQERGR